MVAVVNAHWLMVSGWLIGALVLGPWYYRGVVNGWLMIGPIWVTSYGPITISLG